ncbi:MAG: PorV/PorQ family protein [Elusimicrobia bacterium]|nr:PorV/PorQ family protein [Elusimicrobiota bacterium]
MQVLKSDLSPRAAAMGGAFVAVADDVYTMSYNPAGLGQLYIPEASAILHQSGFDDSTLNYISVGLPLPFIGLAGLEKPGFGMSLLLADAGDFEYKQLLPDGGVYSKSFDAQKDRVLAFGYGEKVYSGELNLEGYNARIEQYLGLNVKYIWSKMLDDKNPPSTVAFDGGWLLLEPKLGLSLGASIANYGSGLKYGTEVTRLPSILRLGASWEKPTVMEQSVLLAAEGDFYMAEALKSLRFGLEYHFEKLFNLRLGYKTAEDNSGLTMGLGLHYNDMSLDFATGMGNEVFNSTQLAFSYKFSGIVVKEYRKKVSYKDPEPRKGAPAKAVQPARQESKPAKPARSAPEKKKDSDFFWIY